MAHRPAPADELSVLHAENRHLKDSMAAMRQAMEALVLDKNATVQQAVAASRDELKNMRETIASLRDALEALHGERDRQVQEAVARGKVENNDLQAAIQAMRAQLELELMAERERFSVVRRGYEDELAQLRKTVAALREALEAKVVDHAR